MTAERRIEKGLVALLIGVALLVGAVLAIDAPLLAFVIWVPLLAILAPVLIVIWAVWFRSGS